MKRGDLYRVYRPAGDPKLYRVFVVVSRQTLVESRFSTLVCAPVYTRGEGLLTQVPVGTEEGLKHSSWIVCDDLKSIRKSDLLQYVGSLSREKVLELDRALAVALDLFQ
jgi:mRNA interferase MazF